MDSYRYYAQSVLKWNELYQTQWSIALSSMAVVANRTTKIMTGAMTSDETRRMIFEKPLAFSSATTQAMLAASSGKDTTGILLDTLKPISKRTKNNARRLAK
jgi:hypothetical protein